MESSNAAVIDLRGGAWRALRRELAGALTITDEQPHGFAALAREGRRVLVEHVAGSTVDWLVVRAPICRQEEMDLERALERNAALAVATLSLMRGTYWLRMAVPFDSAELGVPSRLVSLCIEAARSLSPVRVAPPIGASDLFSHYAE